MGKSGLQVVESEVPPKPKANSHTARAVSLTKRAAATEGEMGEESSSTPPSTRPRSLASSAGSFTHSPGSRLQAPPSSSKKARTAPSDSSGYL